MRQVTPISQQQGREERMAVNELSCYHAQWGALRLRRWADSEL